MATVLLGGRKTLSIKNEATHLTPTGLLMEGDYTHPLNLRSVTTLYGRSNTSSPCPSSALSPDAAISVLVLLSGRAFPSPRSEFPWFGRRPRVEQVDPEALLPVPE